MAARLQLNKNWGQQSLRIVFAYPFFRLPFNNECLFFLFGYANFVYIMHEVCAFAKLSSAMRKLNI